MRAIIPRSIYGSRKGKYPYLQDLIFSDDPSNILEKKTAAGTIMNLPDEIVEGFLEMERYQDLVVEGLNNTSVPTFLELVEEVIDACLANPELGNYIEVSLWLELSDLSILVAPGMPNRLKDDESVMTWSEYIEAHNNIVVRSSINNPSKKILSTNVLRGYLSMERLKSVLTWSKSKASATALSKYQVKEKLKSAEYTPASEI